MTIPNHSDFVNTKLGGYILEPKNLGWPAINQRWRDAGNVELVPLGHYRAVMYAMMYDGKTLEEATEDWVKPPPPPPIVGRKGPVRIQNRMWVDDDGPFYSLSATCFALFSHSESWVRHNLPWLQQAGVGNLRILSMVGGVYWANTPSGNLGIFPHRPGYWQNVAARLNLARTFGFRFKLVLFAGAQDVMPNRSDKFLHCDKWLEYTKGKEDQFLHIEIANEYWQNGVDLNLLKELTAHVRARTSIPVAPSSGLDSHAEVAFGDLLTAHPDRDPRERNFRPTRQMWDVANAVDMPRSNNEPTGPGASGSGTDDPMRLITDCLTTHISGGLDYTLHMDAGIAGHEGAINYENHSNAPAIRSAFRVSRDLLPPDIANWSRQNWYWDAHPFKDSFLFWTEGERTGVNRAFAAIKGDEFVVLLSAIKEETNPIAVANMRYDIINIPTGDEEETVMQNRGSSHRITGDFTSITGDFTTKLLRGRFV